MIVNLVEPSSSENVHETDPVREILQGDLLGKLQCVEKEVNTDKARKISQARDTDEARKISQVGDADKSRKISLVERVQGLPVVTSPDANVVTSPVPTPVPTPQSSPRLQRKVLGVAMEQAAKSVTHSFFCTKPFQSAGQGGTETVPSQAGEVALSGVSALQSKQPEQPGILATQAIEENAKSLMGKRRPRPKPSTLREMNFWAPTSM